MTAQRGPAVRPRTVVAGLAAVLVRPSLWPVALRQAVALARPRWWARPPFLPVPDRDYLRFRLMTVYGGDGSAQPPPEDLTAFLRWCRDWPASSAPEA